MSADSPPLAVDARPPGLIQAHALFPSPSGAKRVTCWARMGWEPERAKHGGGVCGSVHSRPALIIGALDPRW